MFGFGKKNVDQRMSFKVLVHNGNIATMCAGMPILVYDGRYITINGVRRIIEVAKLQPRLWNRIPALKDLKEKMGYEADDIIYALVIPSWTMQKFKLFKPMNQKDIDRTISYLAAKYIFGNTFMDTNSTSTSTMMFLDGINGKLGMEASQKNYCAIMRVLQMFEDKDGYLTSTDLDMAAQFIAAITEDCNAADIRNAVAKAAKTSGKDIGKVWKKDKKDTRKKKKNGDSLNVEVAINTIMYGDSDDDMDDEPPVEEKPSDEKKSKKDKKQKKEKEEDDIPKVAAKVKKEMNALATAIKKVKDKKDEDDEDSEEVVDEEDEDYIDAEPAEIQDMDNGDVEDIDEEDEIPDQPLVEQATIVPDEDDQE